MADETSPFEIMNDTDLLNAVSTYGWSGNGSADNPFIIENLTINGSGTNHCLQMFDLNNYTVIIRNNHFYGTTKTSQTYDLNAALVLQYCVNITISNNTIEDNALVAMSLYRCNATIEGNTIRGSRNGINAEFGTYRIRNNTAEEHYYAISVKGPYLEVTNNTLIGNDGQEGIWIGNGPAEVAWNNISGFSQGIETHTSSLSVYHNNTIRDCHYGFQVRGGSAVARDNTIVNGDISLWSLNTTLINNTIKGGRVTFDNNNYNIDWLWSHTISTSNTVDGKPVLYIASKRDIDIDPSQYGQIILANSSNVSLKDRTFTHWFYFNSFFGTNLSIEGNLGVLSQPVFWRFESTANVSFSNNTLKNVSCSFYKTNSITVLNNTFIHGGTSINVKDGHASVHNNTIEAHGTCGFFLEARDSKLTIMDNKVTLVDPESGAYAMNVDGTNANYTFKNNALYGSGMTGAWDLLTSGRATFYFDQSNTVNDRPVLFMVDEQHKTVTGSYGEVIIVSSDDIKVEGLFMGKGDGGVRGLLSSNLMIRNCTFQYQYMMAILLHYCDNVTVVGSLFERGLSTIYLNRCNEDSTKPFGMVKGNYFINVSLTSWRSGALDLYYSSLDSIEGNYFEDIGGFGLYAWEGTAETIVGNEFKNCSNPSYTGRLRDFIAYNNSFLDNAVNTHGSQVDYTTSDTQWDNNSTGNYWSNYETRYPNASKDGLIWDTPYEIWPDEFEDRYPLVNYTDRIAPMARIDHNDTIFNGTVTTLRAWVFDNIGVSSYSWSFDDGKTWTSGNATVDHTWSAPGEYRIMLRVWDTSNNMGQTTGLIEVLDVTKPIADAGDDFTIAPEVGVYLNGSRSTDDVGIVRAEWYITCEHGTSKWIGLVVGVRFHHEGVYDCNLTVWDAAGNSDSDHITVTVADLEPPVAVIGEDQVVPQHTTLDLNGTASTDNWMIASWNWTITSPDDGTTYYNTSEISHTFDEAGVHTVTLRVTDLAGLWNSTSINVTVIDTTKPQPVPGRDLTIDQGETVHLNGTGSWDNVGIVNWTWTVVGPGVNATYHSPEANHTFPDAGVYTATLRVEDAAGLNASATLTITVRDTELPFADAGADVTVDEGAAVYLDPTNSTDNVGIESCVWNFTYDGEERVIPYIAAPYLFYFEIPGVYIVTLTVADARGNEDTDQVVVTVRDTKVPHARAGEDLEVDQHTQVTFNASMSTDNVGIVNWTWTFEYDGEERLLEGPTSNFTFDLPGVYTITLTVADAAGHTDQDTLVITVLDITPPVPAAGDDVHVEAGTTVAFDGSASSDDVGVAIMEWSFTYDGEPRTLEGIAPEFTFLVPGVYTVTLVVADDAGNAANDTLTVTVVDTTAPVALAGDDVSVLPGGTVELNASASTDNVGILKHKWTFTYDGEERTLMGPTASYAFDLLGQVVITLTVEDASGNTATDTLTVTVEDPEPPVADAGEDITLFQGATYALDGTGSTDNVGIVDWKWDFTYNGTMVGLNGSSPGFTFDLAGVYVVSLLVLDGAMNTGEDTMVVTVLDTEAPVAVLEGETQIIEVNGAHFDASDSTDNVGIVSYTWTFGENGIEQTTEGPTVVHVFPVPGVYLVTLKVEDARGNSDTDTMTVEVQEFRGDPGPEDEDGGLSLVLVGGVVAAAVVVALMALLLLRRRNGGE